MTALRNRIIAAALAGIPPRRIAADIGCNMTDAYSAISWARRNGTCIPHFKPGVDSGPRGGRWMARVPREQVARLRAEAAARGLPDAHVLAARLLTVIARDDLFAAILDDSL